MTICWKVRSQHTVPYTVTFLRCTSARERFGRQASSGCEGKVGSISEIGPKCAINFEHIEVHVYNFCNFIKSIFGVIGLLIMLFIKKKLWKKEKAGSNIRSSIFWSCTQRPRSRCVLADHLDEHGTYSARKVLNYCISHQCLCFEIIFAFAFLLR